jgi:hypothetical protein
VQYVVLQTELASIFAQMNHKGDLLLGGCLRGLVVPAEILLEHASINALGMHILVLGLLPY